MQTYKNYISYSKFIALVPAFILGLSGASKKILQ